MRRRFALRTFYTLALLVGSAVAGCGSDAHQHTDAGVTGDADFSVCEGTPAVIYAPGISVTSTGGGYVATLLSATTATTPPVNTPEIGWGTWVVSITDAGGNPAAGLTMTAERPEMPRHGHGATTYPVVTPGDPGTFTVSEINFFMAGYWTLQLNLMPASGAADDVVFAICIPQ
jgi:hypothetical protein